ncbi:MAG: peptidoglycan-binding protein, partial [Bacilli bacterium]|nr:peptidoglycan-binding protein [Bacilli bacterium]
YCSSYFKKGRYLIVAVRYPIVPNTITVHLGKPDEAARNVTVPFTEYISNVASSELYPTWPKNALIANIYAIISFALNRIYNEWYPSKGYQFDITSNPSYDQTYTENRSTYENIDVIVDDIFNNYVVKGNQVQPYFTTYCDGRNKTCSGLSQWGSVTLASQGKTPLQILQTYYGSDISIKMDAPVGEGSSSYPGFDLTLGSFGNPVLEMQRDLRRISKNYPAIPGISTTLGIYDEETKEAVKKFQSIFSLPVTGVVDKGTWYKIKYIYTSVKKLSDLYGEGVTKEEATFLYNDELKYGDTGIEVQYIHYFLDAIAFLDPDIPRLKTNSIYTNNTIEMVKAFQEKYQLPVTGIITYADFKVLIDVYDNILKSFPKEYQDYVSELYPDYFLTRGMSGKDVKRFQKFLLAICKFDKSIPGVRVNGVFDELTEASVLKIQKDYGFDVNGIVGPLLWKKVVELSKR